MYRVECYPNEIYKCVNCGRYVHTIYIHSEDPTLHEAYNSQYSTIIPVTSNEIYLCIDCLKQFNPNQLKECDMAITTDEAELRCKRYVEEYVNDRLK